MCGQYQSVISRGDNAASIPHIFVVRKPFSFIESYWAPKYGIDDPFIYQYKIPNKHTTTTLWKESLNSDGHPFYQIKKNEQSPLILTELTTTTCDIGNPVPALVQAQKCSELSRLMGPNSPLLITGSPCTDSLPLKKTTYCHTNEWQYKHGQYNRRVSECS
jgi:hypothetical protein